MLNNNEKIINKNSPIPLYFQLEEIIKEKIKFGLLVPGDSIPTEKKLEENYGISRTTIRQAINNLKRDGYLEVRRSKGTFVKFTQFDEPVLGIRSYTEEAVKQGFSPGSNILKFEKIKPVVEIREELKLDENDLVFKIKRLRFLNGKPTAIDTSYVPSKLVPKLAKDDFKESGYEQSLYYILEKKYGLELSEAEEIIDATTINNEESLLLELEVNSPINLRIRVVFLSNGTPVCYMKSIYKNRYRVKLSR